jgi:predicted DNA-binding protein YlxM (UPF0122 family)
MTRTKRKYKRLLPSQWAELSALWESGDHTLAELSDRYGVSQRAIQSHFKKHGCVKGAKAAEMTAVVKEKIFKDELGNKDALTYRAREMREDTYNNAKLVEGLIMAQLQIAQKDPTQAFKASTAMKTLSLAAAALERLHATKLRALGLDRDNAPPTEMPVLTFRDLTPAEIEERREPDEEDDLGTSIVPESSAEIDSIDAPADDCDDIIVEGEELEEPTKPDAASLITHGGRLVKGHSH